MTKIDELLNLYDQLSMKERNEFIIKVLQRGNGNITYTYDEEDIRSRGKSMQMRNKNAEHGFVVHKCSWKYCKQTGSAMFLDKSCPILAYIYDVNDRFLPDTSPEWLYDIFNEIEEKTGGIWEEHMESIFGMNKKFYDELIKHPACIHEDTIESQNDEKHIDDWKNNK